MTDTRLARIENLQKKAEVFDNKIKNLQLQKRKVDKEIKELEQQLYMTIINDNHYTVPTLKDDLQLIKILKDNNITTQQDVLDMLSIVGGNDNEN